MHASLLVCCLTLLGPPGSPPGGPPGSSPGDVPARPADLPTAAPSPSKQRVDAPGPQRLDAAAFFERLVARYRGLASYRDLTSVVQITRDGPGSKSETQRTETQMICDVLDGELRIVTPGSQLRSSLRETLGMSVRIRGERATDKDEETGDREVRAAVAAPDDATSPSANDVAGESPSPLGALALRYQLWLAPHLALKFAEDPLAEFRPANHEPFTATEASAVTVEDRVMVHVELKSGRLSACNDAPDDFDAKFDLYVNPESMLIERIEGRERLPDGGSIETTYTINPIAATAMEGAEPIEALMPACAGDVTPAVEGQILIEPAVDDADAPDAAIETPQVAPPPAPPLPLPAPPVQTL